MYDFHKTRNDNNENEFKHKMFLKNCKYTTNYEDLILIASNQEKVG